MREGRGGAGHLLRSCQCGGNKGGHELKVVFLIAHDDGLDGLE